MQAKREESPDELKARRQLLMFSFGAELYVMGVRSSIMLAAMNEKNNKLIPWKIRRNLEANAYGREGARPVILDDNARDILAGNIMKAVVKTIEQGKYSPVEIAYAFKLGYNTAEDFAELHSPGIMGIVQYIQNPPSEGGPKPIL